MVSFLPYSVAYGARHRFNTNRSKFSLAKSLPFNSIIAHMAAKIHVVRHAESVHNIDKDFSRLDPALTLAGRQQAQILGGTFPFQDTIGLIITSPLRRTIQTTLLAFTNVLDKNHY
jgi:hypothetical protein